MSLFKRLFILSFILANISCNDERLDPILVECSINNLSPLSVECNDDETYDLTLDFNTNTEEDSFDVFVREDVLVGNFNTSDLPLTISNFEPSGLENDYIKVCITDDPDCCSEIEFSSPDCP